MSSTLIVTAGASAAMTSVGSVGAAALLGPLGLGIVLGTVAISFFAGADSGRTERFQPDVNIIQQQEEIRRAQELQQHQLWTYARLELHNQASEIKTIHDRKLIENAIDLLQDSYMLAIKEGNSSLADHIIEEMRGKILSVQMNERMLESRRDKIMKAIEELEAKAPEGFSHELADMKRNIPVSWHSLAELSEKIGAVSESLQVILGDVSMANALSLNDLEEETAFIPTLKSPAENCGLNASFVKDICDFGERIAFFDENEAARLEALIIEAEKESSVSRLKAVRDQIKAVYGRLRERAILTEMFRRDLGDFLPPMKKAVGTEELCVQIEDLMTASYITREEFSRIYRAVKEVFSSQIESIVDKLFAEKIGGKLKSMGYSLADEAGNPVDVFPGKVCTLSTPYEGYQMRLKIGRDKSIVTRLVRTVESEEEKAHVSEYQRQKDTETGKKLCADLREFYKSLEDEGIKVHELMRKEPGQEALDIIIAESPTAKAKKSTASLAQTQQKFNARSI